MIFVLHRASHISTLGISFLTFRLKYPRQQLFLNHLTIPLTTYPGHAFTITPPSPSILLYYPTMHTEYHACVNDVPLWLYAPDGRSVKAAELEWNALGTKHTAGGTTISFLKTQSSFAKMFLDQANRLHIKVSFGNIVIEFFRVREH